MRLQLILATVSLFCYTLIFGFPNSIILFCLILIHEYGHLLALKKLGIGCKGIYFIPLIGGLTVPCDGESTLKDSSIVALSGPIFSTIVALLLSFILFFTQALEARTLVYVAAVFALFDLMPILPLDGGRLTSNLLSSLKKSRQSFHLTKKETGTILLTYIATIGVLIGIATIAYVPTHLVLDQSVKNSILLKKAKP